MSSLVLDDLSRRYTVVEVPPVAIAAYAEGNTGIPYVWSFEAEAPGPHVVVCAIMHGNEIAGAAVLDRLLREGVRPAHGRLTLIFGNPEAYARFDPARPYENRFVDIDMNRIWGAERLDPARNEYEIRRARELFPVIDSADALLDIHTMQGQGPAVALVNGTRNALPLAAKLKAVGFVLYGKMPDSDRLRIRDLPHFMGDSDGPLALQIEAGQHWSRQAVEVADRITRQFLDVYGILPAPRNAAPGARQKTLEVVQTVFSRTGRFTYAQDFHSGHYFPTAGTLIGHDEDGEIVTPQDGCYLIMPVHFRRPGGSVGRFARPA